MAEGKIYCGSGKTIKTQYGDLLKLSLGPKDIQTLYDNRNDKGWINLMISPRKEVGKYGETHSVCVDTWRPENQTQESPKNDVQDGGPETW